MSYLKAKKIDLRNHPTYNERWLHQRIMDDPTLLGLGDVFVKDSERVQPRGGRLDLLLQDSDAPLRYEVELQLGRCDESHIIRSIEYWDIERRRYPQYDHVAVLVAEDITSRFLNVIGLFNGFIPIMAFQLSAVQVGEHVSLVFTKILDQMTLGLVDEDESTVETVDRSVWETKASKPTVKIADEVLELIQTFAPSMSLKYNKHYIGLVEDDRSSLFAWFKPRKKSTVLGLKMPPSEDAESEFEDAGVEVVGYDSRWRMIRVRITPGDPKKHAELLTKYLEKAKAHYDG